MFKECWLLTSPVHKYQNRYHSLNPFQLNSAAMEFHSQVRVLCELRPTYGSSDVHLCDVGLNVYPSSTHPLL